MSDPQGACGFPSLPFKKIKGSKKVAEKSHTLHGVENDDAT